MKRMCQFFFLGCDKLGTICVLKTNFLGSRGYEAGKICRLRGLHCRIRFVFLQLVWSNLPREGKIWKIWKIFGKGVLMTQWELEDATGTVGKVFA